MKKKTQFDEKKKKKEAVKPTVLRFFPILAGSHRFNCLPGPVVRPDRYTFGSRSDRPVRSGF
jgi:hypothetical protein